eukprot:CFRG2088T1
MAIRSQPSKCASEATACCTEDRIHPPSEFPFPFIAYKQQRDFMRHLFECIERGDMGIFESPTGTGKSMSLICGALAWLKAHHTRPVLEPVIPSVTDELDWVSEFVPQRASPVKSLFADTFRSQFGSFSKRHKSHHNSSHSAMGFESISSSATNKINEIAFDASAVAVLDKELMVDYESCDEESSEIKRRNLNCSDSESEDSNAEDFSQIQSRTPKIIYCSRTHSQISQFVGELKQSPYGDEVGVTSLASRQQMCINHEVKALGTQSRINDRCLELKDQRGKSKKGRKQKGCMYYNHKKSKEFVYRIHNQVRDIEDLVTLGTSLETCPYYGARRSVPLAEIVCVPYNMLLHSATREATGINLSENIVIIDEAHNLIDTLTSVYSVPIDEVEIVRAKGQLTRYFERYKSRLSRKNTIYIQQILFILKRLSKALRDPSSSSKTNFGKTSYIQSVTDFVFDLGIDNINLFKLVKYCDKAMLVRKLHGFVDHMDSASMLDGEEVSRKGSAMQPIVDFLTALQGIDRHGRIMITCETPIHTTPTYTPNCDPKRNMDMNISRKQNLNPNNNKQLSSDKPALPDAPKIRIKYLVLSAADKFTDVLSQARSVILCGGTMSPYNDFADQLVDPEAFDYKLKITREDDNSSIVSTSPTRNTDVCHVVPKKNNQEECFGNPSVKGNTMPTAADRELGISLFSCDHVIPPENLIALCVGVGPSGKKLSFTFENRKKIEMIDELGRLVLQTCKRVPDGVVCFFASYDYASIVHDRWQSTGALKDISGVKTILREDRGGSQQKLDDLLNNYSMCIRNSRANPSHASSRGALLLSVVGGKLSEGINFKDELGRCVIMVGLPFPNKRSPELSERMRYLDSMTKNHNAGGQYYTSLCMRAVNQSIGRAIRHKDDYASIVLVDDRYLKTEVQKDLPKWIRQRTFTCATYGFFFSNLVKFFKVKRT